MSKKILLISPPFYRLMGSHYNGLHLGLGYIASFLERHGHQVFLYNADFEDSNVYLDQRELLDNFDHYKQVLGDLGHPIWDEVRKALQSSDPDYVGIQMYTGTFKSAQNVARLTKEYNKEIQVIVGGTHPTLDVKGAVGFEYYDFAVKGEGEFTFLDLAEGKGPAKIENLAYKDDEAHIVENPSREQIPDLDGLPFPKRDGFLVGNERQDVGGIITSRGCPYSCSYCTSPRIWHGKVRYRGVESILEELRLMTEVHGVSLVRFQDDTFTLNKLRVVRILRGMIERGLKIEWVCDTRVDKIDYEILRLMKEAGCVRVKIGVESGSDEILKRVNKGITVKQIKRAVEMIKGLNIPLTIYLMIGFPGETDEDVRKTIALAEEIEADYYSLSVIAPYYGTKMYFDLVNNGFRFGKSNWEYFFHQSKEMIMNVNISQSLVDEFWALNDKGKGKRV